MTVKFNHSIGRISLLMLILFSSSWASGSTDGKIPITTSSEKAKQYFQEGRNLADKLRIQESVQYFQKAVAEDPTFATGYLNLATSAQSNKDFFDNLKKAVSLVDHASEGERLVILAQQAAANGSIQKQKEYCETLVEKFPNDERAHNQLATIHFGLQNYQAAVGEYEKAIQINPEFSPAYNLLGYSYRFLEQYDKSEKAFQKYVKLIPDDPNPYDSYAELLMKMGRYDDSIANYRKALKADPHFVASYLGIASNLVFEGKHEAARSELQNLFGRARNDGEMRTAHFAMTVTYLDEGKTEKALEEQKTMYELAAKSNDAGAMSGDLNTMGMILLDAGRGDEAKAKFDEATKLIQESGLSEKVKQNNRRLHLFNTAQVALYKKDYKSAKAAASDLRKQAEEAGNQFQVWLAHELAGRIALAEEQPDLAISELKQANLQNPYNLYRLGLAYRAKGEKKSAVEMFHKAANHNTTVNFNLALIRARAKSAESM